MNTDQFNSLIRSIIKIIGAALVAHGLTNAGSIVNSPDVIGVIMTIAGLVWSHYSLSGIPIFGLDALSSAAYGPEAALTLLIPLGLLGVHYIVPVSAAMTAWGSYVAANHPPASQELAVRAAFEKYQAAELLAIDATASYTAATSINSSAALASAPVRPDFAAAAAIRASTSVSDRNFGSGCGSRGVSS